MTGVVAGIGFKAILGGVVGKAASAGGSALKWLGSLDLVHLCLLIAVLFGGWQTVGRWAQHRHTAKVEAQLSASAAQLAASRANEAGLEKAIADQNAAIANLGAKSAQQQGIAAKALQTAAQRANEAQATSERLKASSRVVPLKSAPACEPSDTLKGQWQ